MIKSDRLLENWRAAVHDHRSALPGSSGCRRRWWAWGSSCSSWAAPWARPPGGGALWHAVPAWLAVAGLIYCLRMAWIMTGLGQWCVFLTTRLRRRAQVRPFLHKVSKPSNSARWHAKRMNPARPSSLHRRGLTMHNPLAISVIFFYCSVASFAG